MLYLFNHRANFYPEDIFKWGFPSDKNRDWLSYRSHISCHFHSYGEGNIIWWKMWIFVVVIPVAIFVNPHLPYTEKFVVPMFKFFEANLKQCLFVCLMLFNTTFNNISVISWQSVLLVGETGGPVASHWLTLSLNVVVHLALIEDSNSQHQWW